MAAQGHYDEPAAMSVILAINRDFPFQVALSFDDAAMEVLDWLEGCSFSGTCMSIFRQTACDIAFRTVTDAWAFKQQFAHAQEGRAVAGQHERGSPYQVASQRAFAKAAATMTFVSFV